MIINQRCVLLHGLEGSSQGYKANYLRSVIPGLLTPDFRGSLSERMEQLDAIFGEETDWTVIGSSFGGLMGALFTCQHPHQVSRLILLAPALIWPEFAADPPTPVANPTVIFHGDRDEVIPLGLVQTLAERVFINLQFNVVRDDHRLHKTVLSIDWKGLIAGEDIQLDF
jgi:pimeloyl-ACP methyl ester carboxylesterase